MSEIGKTKIENSEWEPIRISNAANRPNAKTAYGPGKTADQTKAIFDAPLDLLKERHNNLESYVRDVETPREHAEMERVQAEEDRNATESIREINEDNRIAAEEERKTAEDKRALLDAEREGRIESVETLVGDVERAIDAILALQDELIGGGS